jgi:DNA-binding NtrC family response regulator
MKERPILEKTSRLHGLKILIVDDETDVLDTLTDLLPMCDLKRATNFRDAKELLDHMYFDIAILDIMGVDGYELLKIAKKRSVIPVMLTAHAISQEDIVKSYKGGAASYIPKDEMTNITTYLNDILEAKEQGKSFWWRWMDRFAESFCEKRFGPDWRQKDPEFWGTFQDKV